MIVESVEAKAVSNARELIGAQTATSQSEFPSIQPTPSKNQIRIRGSAFHSSTLVRNLACSFSASRVLRARLRDIYQRATYIEGQGRAVPLSHAG